MGGCRVIRIAIGFVTLGLALAWPPDAPGQNPPSAPGQTRIAAAQRILRHAASEAASLQRPEERAILTSLARSQARAGDVGAALASLAQVPSNLPDTQNTLFALQEIATAQARAGDVRGAMQTLALLPAGYPRQEALRAVTRAQAAASDVPGALRTAESAGSGPARDGMLAGVALVQAEAGDVVGALKIAALLSDDRSRAAVLVRIGSAQAGAGDVAGGLQTVSLVQSLQDQDPDVEATLAHLHALNKDFTKAVQIAKSLRSGRGTMVLAAVPALQAKAGDLQGALKTVDEIPDVRWHGTSWRALALHGVVAALADRGDLVRARLIAGSMLDRSVQPLAVMVVARAQARSGDVAGALQTVAKIHDAETRSTATNAIALALARRGNATAALQVATTVTDADRRHRIVAAVAEAQAELGDLAGARATAATIDAEGSRQGAAWRIAVAAAKGGDPNLVLSSVTAQSSSPHARVSQLLGVVEELLRNADRDRQGLPGFPGLDVLDLMR